jgi:glycosyltransferase involved in cell wall biosynthesis
MRFCLVTTHHLCNNPRLVKEADTLSTAGHDVRVVWLDARADLRARDDQLTATRRWRLHPVATARLGVRGWIGWAADGIRRKLARRLSDAGIGGRWLAEESLERWPRAMEHALGAAPADVVVAHTLGALPPAARAARALGARLVFDAEDLHAGELPDIPANARERARIARVEREYLPRCDRLIASSDGIADELGHVYGVARPHVVLNAFPLPAGASSTAREPEDAPVRLYWFSQVIGTDRGLQSALDAMALLGDGFELYLRGEDRPGLTDEIRAHAFAVGVAGRVRLLPVAPPDELPSLATEYDVGLALETGHSRNNALAVSNKLLTYLAAGLAIAAADTPGQRGVLRQVPGVGFLFAAGDAKSLADGLRELAAEPDRLAAAKRASRRAAEERFSWEHEQRLLLDALTNWHAPSASSPGSALLPA